MKVFLLRWTSHSAGISYNSVAVRAAINFHYNAGPTGRGWRRFFMAVRTMSRETETRPVDVDFLPLVPCCLASFVFGVRSVALFRFLIVWEFRFSLCKVWVTWRGNEMIWIYLLMVGSHIKSVYGIIIVLDQFKICIGLCERNQETGKKKLGTEIGSFIYRYTYALKLIVLYIV